MEKHDALLFNYLCDVICKEYSIQYPFTRVQELLSKWLPLVNMKLTPTPPPPPPPPYLRLLTILMHLYLSNYGSRCCVTCETVHIYLYKYFLITEINWIFNVYIFAIRENIIKPFMILPQV